ncbi:MAG: substrate-binding domain-containing protein [Lachnospiraceae bacterium]|jgi:inositol transport system substrate-binding protein|nr:substrate-binding domain-containing protein [Lachnospiraceae bacterium]MCI9358348.1 substrate-binding domain-containing protein [Lachnospiraceae bacterium]
MKRKLMAVILAAGLAVSMAGCSGGAPAPQGSSDSAEGETVEDTAEMGEESGGGVETDIVVSDKEIQAAAENSKDWEKEFAEEYDISGDEEFTWGYIDMGFEDTFTTKIRNTFVKYCEQNFPNVKVLEADGEMDANIQLQLAENFIAQGVDCIILDPTDADGCVGIVDTCMAEGVPLVAVNAVIHSDHLEKEVGFVGSSNYEAGEIQGQWLIDNVDDSETVNLCYQRGTEGYDHTTQRYNGLFDTLDDAKYNYELKADLIGDYMRDIAMTNAEDWVTSFGNEIQVVACANDEMAMGSLQAYQAADLAKEIKFLGIDANQDCLQEVKNGNVACTVFQNAMGQAKWTAVSAYDACINGSKETASFSIPFEKVDQSNVDDYLD